MKVLAPGKLILSGEHSVVYGQPAIAMSINRYAITTAVPHLLPFISFNLADLEYERRVSLTALEHLKNQIKIKYKRFIHGEFKIKEVLQKPFELAQFAFSLFVEYLNLKLTQGLKIQLHSNIPIGCGLGSSAATILSIVHALAHSLGVDIPKDIFLRLALEAENMQHGHSSGLDLQISMNGGCLYMEEGKLLKRDLPQFPMYLVHTGTPITTTGECVSEVSHHFKSSSIAEDFGAVTREIDQAFQNKNLERILQAVKDNHQLLTTIGVVPHTIQHFLNEVLVIGSGKICGAGATRGEQAGMVLVITEDESQLKKICEKYHYHFFQVEGTTQGVHIV